MHIVYVCDSVTQCYIMHTHRTNLESNTKCYVILQLHFTKRVITTYSVLESWLKGL